MDFVPKTGSETAIELDDIDGDWRFVAVDFEGEELGRLYDGELGILSSLSEDGGLLRTLITTRSIGAILAAVWQWKRGISFWLRYRVL
ncbi:hypothetical protein BDV23DRAFT_188827 [Aspergillus alliaceus]|uniref:Uncharacterized protein n=1 Tax=Petromyces alliaceus TaxID=209559 RepID=A0A5N7BTE5_PETAA|nr:hypothetical protein BDV23DRAFT_188827 [Aspergillus alliaceus]